MYCVYCPPKNDDGDEDEGDHFILLCRKVSRMRGTLFVTYIGTYFISKSKNSDHACMDACLRTRCEEENEERKKGTTERPACFPAPAPHLRSKKTLHSSFTHSRKHLLKPRIDLQLKYLLPSDVRTLGLSRTVQ